MQSAVVLARDFTTSIPIDVHSSFASLWLVAAGTRAIFGRAGAFMALPGHRSLIGGPGQVASHAEYRHTPTLSAIVIHGFRDP